MGGGKSTVASLLRQMGFEVLDADEVARKVLSPGSPGEKKVFQTFGEDLKNERGELDRRALGRVVFGHPDKLAELEGIIHPLVKKDVLQRRKKLADARVKAAFYDVPLLYEKNMQGDFDFVIVVTAPKDLRASRVQSRSQLTLEEIEARNMRHLPPEFKEKAASAVIRNSGSLEDLQKEIQAALKKLKVTIPG